MASRTLVNQTSSNRAMATPILIFWAAWAGVLPSAIAIMAIAGRKNFASFIFFILILFFLGGCSATRRGQAEISNSTIKQRGTFWGVPFQFFPGVNVHCYFFWMACINAFLLYGRRPGTWW